MKTPKVLFFDIETSPNVAYVWGKYEQDAIAFQKEWELLCFAYKWEGEKQVKTVSRVDFKDKTDKQLTCKLWELFDEADFIVAHNGDQFDIKKAKAKFIEHGLKPPTSYVTIDTRKIARQQFSFNSNSLNDLGKLLKLGQKVPTGGFDLWLGCMAGKKASWKKMIEYNRQDVVLLEKVYHKLKGWRTTGRANYAPFSDSPLSACPACGNNHTIARGITVLKSGTYPRRTCRSCGHCFRLTKKIKV